MRAALSFVLLIAWTVSARAELDASADPVAAARAHLLAQGASDVREMSRSFLFEGQASVLEARLEQDDCVAFLALGTGEVRDVDLNLYTRAGQPLAEDVSQRPFAYARVCGARGLSLYVDATMFSGRGELVVLRVDGAPRALDRLPEEIRFAVSAGGRAEQTRSVGAAPDELALDLKLEQPARVLAGLGYRPYGGLLAMELRAGTAEGKVQLEPQRCYRVLAYVPVSRGVALDVIAPDERRAEARTASEERIDVPLCTQLGGTYGVRVQARPMRSVAIVRVFEHPGVTDPKLRALGAARALAWAEADVVAQSRGFKLEPLGEAWVESGVMHSWPVVLSPGRCHAFAVVAEGGAAAVDVRLISENGKVLARNEGRRGVPLVFTCSRSSERARLFLRARGFDALMSVWAAQTPMAEAP